MSEITANQIEHLRLLAFKTNDPAHIENYRSATAHWFQSRVYRNIEREAFLRVVLAYVQHWKRDVEGNLKPTLESLSEVEAKLVAILQPVEAPEAAE